MKRLLGFGLAFLVIAPMAWAGPASASEPPQSPAYPTVGWRFDTPVGLEIATGILAIGDELLVADRWGIAHRMDQAAGAVRDAIHAGESFYGPPVAAQNSLVILLGTRLVSCVDLATARVRWSRSFAVSSARPYLWHPAASNGWPTDQRTDEAS